MMRSLTRLLDLGRRQLRLPCLSRFLSSKTSSLTLVEVDDKTGIATVTMNRPPVNSFNLELLKDLHESIKQVECNKSRGLILTSVSLLIVRWIHLIQFQSFNSLTKKSSPLVWISTNYISRIKRDWKPFGLNCRICGCRSIRAVCPQQRPSM